MIMTRKKGKIIKINMTFFDLFVFNMFILTFNYFFKLCVTCVRKVMFTFLFYYTVH